MKTHRTVLSIFWVILLFSFSFPIQLRAQDILKDKVSTEVVVSQDSVVQKPGFFGKIWQFFKFKKNRDSTEEKRVEKIIGEFYRQEIPPDTLQIDSLSKNIRKRDSLYKFFKFKKNRDSIEQKRQEKIRGKFHKQEIPPDTLQKDSLGKIVRKRDSLNEPKNYQ